MTTPIIARLDEHGDYLHDAYEELRAKLKAVFTAQEATRTAMRAVTWAEAEGKHFEAISLQAQVDEAAAAERVAIHQLELQRTEVEEAGLELRVLEAQARQIPVQWPGTPAVEAAPADATLNPAPVEAKSLAEASRALGDGLAVAVSISDEERAEALRLQREERDRKHAPTAAAPPVGSRLIMDHPEGPIAVTVVRLDGINAAGLETITVHRDGTKITEGGISLRRFKPVDAAEAKRMRDLGWQPIEEEASVTTVQEADVSEKADDLAGADPSDRFDVERPADPTGKVEVPADLPTELALVKGKLKLAALENVNGNLRIALTHIGPRGGEKKVGNLLGTPDGNWQATTAIGKETKSQTEGSWREALDWVLVVNELQPGEAPTAKEPARNNATIAEATERLCAADYQAGDGRLVFGDAWQRADNCLNVLSFMQVGADSAKEMVERITGAAYAADARVDAEALAKEVAGYKRDVAMFNGTPQAKDPPLVDGVDLHGPFGGTNPERFITEAEVAHALKLAKLVGFDSAEALKPLLHDECDGTPSLDTCKLKDYQHLILRVLPARKAVPPPPVNEMDQARAAVRRMAIEVGLNLDELRKVVVEFCDVPDLELINRQHWENLTWNVLPAIGNHRHGHEPAVGDRAILARATALGIPGLAEEAVEPCPRCAGGPGLAHTCSCSIEELQAHARGEMEPDDELLLA